VLLSKRHMPGLFLDVVRRAGVAYFRSGRKVLEAACNDISNW
jgi:hypothetical protein